VGAMAIGLPDGPSLGGHANVDSQHAHPNSGWAWHPLLATQSRLFGTVGSRAMGGAAEKPVGLSGSGNKESDDSCDASCIRAAYWAASYGGCHGDAAGNQGMTASTKSCRGIWPLESSRY